MIDRTIDVNTNEKIIRNSKTPQELISNLVKLDKIIYRGRELKKEEVIGDVIFYMYHNQRISNVSYTTRYGVGTSMYITDLKVRDFSLPKDMIDDVDRRVGELETHYTKLLESRRMVNRMCDLTSVEKITDIYGIRDTIKALVPQTT